MLAHVGRAAFVHFPFALFLASLFSPECLNTKASADPQHWQKAAKDELVSWLMEQLMSEKLLNWNTNLIL